MSDHRDLEQLLAETRRFLERGQDAAFVAKALDVSLLFVTQVEVALMLARRQRAA